MQRTAKERVLRRLFAALAASAVLAAATNCVAPLTASCDNRTTCGDCTAAGSGCGWCDGVCVDGTSHGAASATCQEWAFSSCSGAVPSPGDTGIPDAAPSTTDSSAEFDTASAVDCTAFVDCVSCASAGCAYCSDLGGTCQDATEVSCTSTPMTDPGFCD